MSKFILALILMGVLPLAAQAQNATLIEKKILQLSVNKSEQNVRTELEFAKVLYEISKDDSSVAQEIFQFAIDNPKIIEVLCELADHPLAKGNEDLIYVLAVSVRRDRFPEFLLQLDRPELSTTGVLNLLAVLKGWVIRDSELSEKIATVLGHIRERYLRDGYIWRYRLGTRRYSDIEERTVIEALDKIRAKTLRRS